MKDHLISFACAAALAGLGLTGCATHSDKSSTAPAVPSSHINWSADDAESKLEQAGEQRAEALARFSAGVSYELRGEQEKAWAEFYRAAMADPGNERIVTDVVRRLFAGQQWDRALELLKKAVAEPKSPAVFNALQGSALAQLGKMDEAAAANRAALKKAPDTLLAYKNLVQSYLTKNDLPPVRELLNQAARQPSKDPAYLLQVSELMCDVVRLKATEGDALRPRITELLERVAATKPEDAALRKAMADQYLFVGEFKKAASLYLDLLQENPDLPELREKLTSAYLQSGDRTKAVEQLESVIKENPTKYPQAYYLLGVIAREDKQYDKAIENFRKVLLLRPQFEQAYYDLALAQISAEQVAAALDTLDRAGKDFPRKFVQEYIAAMAYIKAKSYSKALEHLTAAEVLASANEPERLEQVYFQLGATYEQSKDYKQAEVYFRKALEKDPDSSETLNYLGYMWAEQGTNLAEARQMIEKALKLEPDNAAFLDSEAWVLFKLGQFKEALEYELKSLKLTQEPDATLNEHLGDIYQALKQTDKAQESWKKALELEPSDTLRKKLGLPLKGDSSDSR